MTDPLRAFRDIFARFSSAQQGSEAAGSGQGREATPDMERVAGSVGDEQPPRRPDRGEIRDFPLRQREDQDEGSHPIRERGRDRSPSPGLAGHLRAYLDARAEEALASLLEELSGETARETGEALERIREALSDEIGGIREGVASSQHELSRVGRELVRSGASLESVQAAVLALGPALERLEQSFQAQPMQELARERQLREEAERAALDDMLATLDGLEAGMEHGRELVQALSEAQRRLKDTTVQRWWRAMGEATGAKRPLPEVPVDDLQGWMGGLELTHRRLQDALARRGVTPIQAVRNPFDPYLHEAVAVEPCPLEQDGLVLREERRGYRTSDRVLRLAQVVVGQAAPAKTATKGRRQDRASAKLPGGDHEPPAGGDPQSAGQREGGTGGDSPPQRTGEVQG